MFCAKMTIMGDQQGAISATRSRRRMMISKQRQHVKGSTKSLGGVVAVARCSGGRRPRANNLIGTRKTKKVKNTVKKGELFMA